MNEKYFNDLINEYSRFKENLEYQIKYPSVSTGEDDCYIIDESWDASLNFCFQKYVNSRTISLPRKTPSFINDIPTLIDYIKKKKKFKLISKYLIFLIYKSELNKNSPVNYYCGNNNLIIDYKNKIEDSLLIVNPLLYQSEHNIFFISIANQNKIPLFKYIIIKCSTNGKIKGHSNNNAYIYSFNEYIQNINPQQNNIKKIDRTESFKQNLLKIFIYIYYFELCLLESNKKEDIIDEYNEYYIIYIHLKFL